jgi:hypothetical protein
MSDTVRQIGICAGVLALGLTGCDDDGGGGGRDGGGIRVMVDSGSGGIELEDGGPSQTDAGPGGGCSVTGIMPLPAGCLPRCASSTIPTLNACETDPDPAACLRMALEDDTTPPTTLSLGMQTAQLNCLGCFFWQQDTCIAESCPSEFNARQSCREDAAEPAECDAETMALMTCITTNQSDIGACAMPRAMACFP